MGAESIYGYGGVTTAGANSAPAGARAVASGPGTADTYVPEPTWAQKRSRAASKFCNETHADGSPCRARPAKGTGKCAGHARSVGLL